MKIWVVRSLATSVFAAFSILPIISKLGQTYDRSTYESPYLVLEVGVQDLGRHEKYLFDIFPCFGTSLDEERYLVLCSEVFRLGYANLTLFFFVLEVANQNNDNVGIGLLLNLLKPARKVHERVDPRDIVSEYYTVRAAVEYFSYGLEVLLASRVPDLQLEHMAFKFYD
jgi:hypothetical protein